MRSRALRYDPRSSLLAGLDTSELRTRLQAMQRDYMDLASGRKLQSASYAQGDGSKSVTYTAAELPALGQLIRTLQAQLGDINTPRRALRPRF